MCPTSDVTHALTASFAELHLIGGRNLNLGSHAVRSRLSFLDLPAELRLCIYEEALVRRIDTPFAATSSWDRRKYILLHFIGTAVKINIPIGLLRTCKQLHAEAAPIIYSQNIFSANEPHDVLRFLDQIGVANASYVSRMHLWVSYLSPLETWLQTLEMLRVMAEGLRHLEIGFSMADVRRTEEYRGHGGNVRFLHALTQLSGLETIVIEGEYAKHWPSYLRQKTGVSVEATVDYAGISQTSLN